MTRTSKYLVTGQSVRRNPAPSKQRRGRNYNRGSENWEKQYDVGGLLMLEFEKFFLNLKISQIIQLPQNFAK
jgi:hypothetical protein